MGVEIALCCVTYGLTDHFFLLFFSSHKIHLNPQPFYTVGTSTFIFQDLFLMWIVQLLVLMHYLQERILSFASFKDFFFYLLHGNVLSGNSLWFGTCKFFVGHKFITILQLNSIAARMRVGWKCCMTMQNRYIYWWVDKSEQYEHGSLKA